MKLVAYKINNVGNYANCVILYQSNVYLIIIKNNNEISVNAYNF